MSYAAVATRVAAANLPSGGFEIELLFYSKRRIKFDQAAFDRLRRVRNEMAHPSGFGGHAPDSVLATETFEYCLGVVRAFYPYQIHL